VTSAYGDQFFIAQRLYAHADAADGSVVEPSDKFAVHIFRVHFYGDFSHIRCGKQSDYSLEQLAWHCRRGASAYV
jgi:hypothetical protein